MKKSALHTARRDRSSASPRHPLFPLPAGAMASVPVLMLAGVLTCTEAQAQSVIVPRVPLAAPNLPVAPGNSLPSGSPNNTNVGTVANPVYAPTVQSGQFAPYQVNLATSTATITETSNSGILSWNSFNIGSNATLNIRQPSSTSSLLNLVNGPMSPSLLDGVLNANGIVYLYNPSGIVFGKTALVNVNSLFASTLEISDSMFLSGILSPSLSPSFAADPTLGVAPGSIISDGVLNAANGGKIMLFAPNVTNNGVVTAPDGQVIMAGAGKVYLSAPTSTAMRGLLVEVDSSSLPAGTTTSVTNNGAIAVGRGNATLVGLAINQNGTVTAQTSVSLNGSIYLQATDGASKNSTTVAALPSTTGTITLGSGSKTEIDIVDDGNTITQGPGDNPFNPSTVLLTGKTINVLSGAQINATGGNVTFNANSYDAESSGTVNLARGSSINVAGDADAVLPMSSNVISVQLLAELADNLVLRDSSIRGDTLNFDIRTGTSIADISADLAKLPYTVGQLAATGGTVNIAAGASFVQQAGSSLNVSGGKVSYNAGYVNTTKLVSGGALFSDSNAPMDRTYTGIVNLPDGRWDYEPAYSDGMSAGTINLSAPDIALQGKLLGTTAPGQYQRSVDASNRPLGGQLIIGGNPGSTPGIASAYGDENQIVLDNNSTMPAGAALSVAVANNRLDLNLDALNSNGFTRLAAYTSGGIDVAGNLSFGAGGSISLTSLGPINFNGGLTMPGGSLSAKSQDAVNVATGANFNLAGTWTNDLGTAAATLDANGYPSGDIILNGGNLSFNGAQIVLKPDVAIDVSGGAWLNSSKALTYGNGGNITLSANRNALNPQSLPDTLDMGSGVTLQSYGFKSGGTLSLLSNNIQIGGIADVASLWFPADYFDLGGFSNFSINAVNNLSVEPGTRISAVAQNWIFSSIGQWRNTPSGSIGSVMVPGTLNLVGPDGGREPVNVSLNAADNSGTTISGTLTFGKGASLTTDPQATVTLMAGTLLNFDGTINAPAGTINLGLTNIDPTVYVYDPTRSIWIGPDAHLFAVGTTAMLYTQPNGITTGNVLGGGSINIGLTAGSSAAQNDVGYVVVESQTAQGQQFGPTFDVSGTASGPVTLNGTRSTTSEMPIASAGGSITIDAREGILFDGTAQGRAGNSTQQGGSFSMTLIQGQQQIPGYPDTDPATLNIVSGSIPNLLPAGGLPGQSLTGFEDQAWVGTGSFASGGFDRLYFKSQDVINLLSGSGNFALNANASIYLDAPTLRVSSATGVSSTSAQIRAAYVQLGSDDYEYQNNPTANVLANPDNNYFSSTGVNQNNVASSGTGTLKVNATTIDLVGNTVVQGVGNTDLDATQDIRLVGISQTNLAAAPNSAVTTSLPQLMPTGEFSVAGNLTLVASQVYPVTMASFALNAEGVNSTLNFMSNGVKGYAPLSAAGTLYGFAQTINQNGVVEAPFGTIDLVATNQLNYFSGSTTSVAGSGIVPFGTVLNGRQWVYDFGQGNEVAIELDPASTGSLPEISLPQKIIISQAPTIETAASATLNLSGGGSLYAYEFTPGSYGTVDVLGNNVAGSATRVFAILPGYANAVAPRDYQYGQGGGLQPGQSIYLSGIAGLPAGNYVLLPAHYALLPGAFAVTVTTNGLNLVAADNVINANGSFTVSGRTDVLGAGSSFSSAYTVTPESVVRLESQYQDYNLGSYFTSAAASAGLVVPELPADGGQLEFDATNSLALAGQFLLKGTKGGHNGIADISAPVIDVVADASQTVPANAVKLVAGDLANLDADSLLLGGTRQIADGITRLSVGAQTVTIENNAAHPLSGTEIILAAQGNVTLAAGAVVAASGTLQGTPTNIIIQGTDPNGSTAGTDGALLRVSSGAAVSVTRSAPPGLAGVLDITAGATVAASGSAYMDATLDNSNYGQLNLSSGAALGISAPRISLGDAIPLSATGLQFNTLAIKNLDTLGFLQLSSYSTIDLYGNVSLGSSSMKDLVLASSGFQGNYTAGAPGNVSFTAQNVELDGGSNFVAAGPVNTGSAGTFNVEAQRIVVGNGNLAINGYANTSLNATGQISVGGTGSLTASQNLSLTAGVITANAGSVVTVAAMDNLNLSQAGSSPAAVATQLGGNLTFSASAINSNANIDLPSGVLGMTATNGIALTGGTIYTGGAAEVFGSTTAYAPAGSITLNAGNGNLNVAAASTLDVSAVGAAAGLLSVAATGNTSSVMLNGTLKGSASAGSDGNAQMQGSFSLDAGQMTSASQLDQLAVQLNQAGFNQQQTIRVRNGDLTLGSGITMTASQVTLSADNGNVNVSGTINASGAAGGRIGLYASQPAANGGSGNVNLLAGSVLNASATVAATSTTQSTAGSNGTGGTVIISTASADGVAPSAYNTGSNIQFSQGATINVSGNSSETNGDANGTITFRAPQVAGGNDVAIIGLNGNVTGSKLTVVEGYQVYYANQISSAPDQPKGNGTYSNLQAATTSGAVPTSGVMYTDAYNFANGAAVAALAGRSNPDLVMNVVPGIEVRSTGDLTVSVNETSATLSARGWNLDAWHFNGAPVNLTLRAAGDLTINGSISDGFLSTSGLSMPDWVLDQQISGSFRLVGGADLSAANSLNVLLNTPSPGNVSINFPSPATGTPVALVRTGTGSIDIAAGGDVVLGTLVNADPDLTQSAEVYTAGRSVAYDGSMGSFTAPTNALNTQYGASSRATSTAQFAEGGGAISIFAGQNVIGAPEDQLVNNWLFHQGYTVANSSGALVFDTVRGITTNTAWWAEPDYFDQGIATLAGGNVSIVALTGNLQDVSAGVASDAFMPGLAPGALVERGGGNLTVQAGGSINGGSFYVQNGLGTINAGGSIAGGSLQSNGITVNPVFALGNAQLNVTARDNLNIGAIYNPTLAAQSMYNIALTSNVPPSIAKHPQLGNFTTYSDSSAVSFTAVSGNVLMTNNGAFDVTNMGAETIPIAALDNIFSGASVFDLLYSYAPPNVNIAALSGSVTSTYGFSVAGAPKGELNILAANSVSLSGSPLVMTDVDMANFSPYNAPISTDNLLTSTGFGGILGGSPVASDLLSHTEGGLHTGDTDPVRIVALNGNITGDDTLVTTIILPKFAQISAGGTIQDLGFIIQNNSATDVTTVTAGHDYTDTTVVLNTGSVVQQVVDGPGRIDISAGHTVDLGDSQGLVTRGNLDNPYMGVGGAAINIQAGTTSANYAGFVKSYVSQNQLSAADQNALSAYVNALVPGTADTPDAAWTAFQKLSVAQQNTFLNTIKPDLNAIFFADLVASSKISGLTEFDGQIASLFPNINPAGGDINVFASQLKTDQGGSIYTFTPGGSTYAGLSEMPTYLQKSASNLGLFTISGGAIGGLVHDNFEVDQGRVFTLGGGNIALVSQYGDLSAGAGTKTASSAPPPLLETDANGNTVVDISGSISGSGIATLKTNPSVPDGDIYVIAPRGVFDAGDAGVRSSGSVEVNALVVLNAGNIVAAGAVTGVPAVESVNIGAGLSSSATPNVSDITKNITNSNNAAANNDTTLSVDVLGYGAAADCLGSKDGCQSGNGKNVQVDVMTN